MKTTQTSTGYLCEWRSLVAHGLTRSEAMGKLLAIGENRVIEVRHE